MQAPSAALLLDVWERGLASPPVQRALALARTAYPEATADQVADLSIGRRDALLIELRHVLFGPVLRMVAACPRCGIQVESTFQTREIQTGATCDSREQTMDVDGLHLAFRVPTSRDLLALDVNADPRAGLSALLARSVVAAHDARGGAVPAHEIPEAMVERLAAAMAEADPQADVQLLLACPACEQGWQATFDVADFLWREVNAWAQRTLRDVASLAAAYGWREPDILALSPTRRRIYLELSGR